MTALATASYNDSLKAMDTGIKGQSSQALIVQSYSLSSIAQPHVDFSGFDKLKQINVDINNGLDTAKTNGNYYLNTLQPSMITTITDLDAYFNLNNALAQALNPNTPADLAIQQLKAVQQSVTGYKSKTDKLVIDLQSFRTKLSTDASNFKGYTTKLNSIVNGDQGVLSEINDQLDSIDSKIDGAIAGTVLSGLAIAGGVFMIAVGGIADFVTAGASTPLVVAGVGVVAAGVGGEVASAVILGNLLKEKGNLLTEKSQLKSEVNLVTGVSSGLDSLDKQASSAAEATQQMANAWNTLDGHLGNMISEVQSGQTTVDSIRNLFQIAAQGTVKDIQQDSTTIKGQLAGVKITTNTGGNVADMVLNDAKKAAAA